MNLYGENLYDKKFCAQIFIVGFATITLLFLLFEAIMPKRIYPEVVVEYPEQSQAEKPIKSIDEIIEEVFLNRKPTDLAELECLMSALIGEHSVSTEKEKTAFLIYFTKEAKNGFCDEYSKMAGRSKKYSSNTINHIIRIQAEKSNATVYLNNLRIILKFFNFEYPVDDGLIKIWDMSNFMTLKLAVSDKSPGWHRRHLIDYVIIDDTFYGKYDWNRKSMIKFRELQSEYGN
jgi:hypothetical protein